MNSSEKPLERVRILVGYHRGKVGTVLATLETGHRQFDVLFLRIEGPTTETRKARPYSVFRSGTTPVEALKPAPTRRQRFVRGESVVLFNGPAPLQQYTRATVSVVHLDPLPDFQHLSGMVCEEPANGVTSMTCYSARYTVRATLPNGDQIDVTAYDNQLSPDNQAAGSCVDHGASTFGVV